MHDGTSSHDDNDANDSSVLTSHVNGYDNHNTNGTHEQIPATASSNQIDEEFQDSVPVTPSSPTRGRKRKLSETRSPKSKKISPPWKSFSADGPTTFKSEDGRRKSGRQNAVPLELQPQGAKRQTRGEYSKHQDDRTVPAKARRGGVPLRGGKSWSTSRRAPLTSTRSNYLPTTDATFHPGAIKSKGSYHNDHRSAPSVQRSSTRKAMSHQKRASGLVDESPSAQRQNQTVGKSDRPLRSRQPPEEPPRLVLRLGRRSLPILAPGNIPPKRRYESLDEWLRHDSPLEGHGEHLPTEASAYQEANTRLRLVEASRTGRLLRDDTLLLDAEPAEEPFPGHAHCDYLALHAADLRSRMQREAREHRAVAKRLADAAVAAVRSRLPKTAEELEAEARTRTRGRLQSVLKQLKAHLDLASQKIMEIKKQEFLDQEAAAGRERMKYLVDRSEDLLTARTTHQSQAAGHLDNEGEEGEERDMDLRDAGSAVNDTHSVSSEEGDEDTDDSDSSGSNTTDEEDENPDAGLSVEELRAKYAELPDLAQDRIEDQNKALTPESFADEAIDQHEPTVDMQGEDEPVYDESMPDLEDVDDVLLDDEDADTDTSGTPTESDEEISNEDDCTSEDGNKDDLGLLGFFSKNESSRRLGIDIQPPGSQTSAATESESHVAPSEEQAREPGSKSLDVGDASDQSSAPREVVKSEHQLPENDDSENQVVDADEKGSTVPPQAPSGTNLNDLLNYTHQNSEPQLEISSLIRGQLRPYQHAGFEWLAGMYENNTNGILADEMGLGKTFQTIALLAYLATRHHAWGPHLIVVPTSVILNWEIEFKKFLPGFKVLPYYGSQDERKEKRKGWNNEDKWNIVITSYQLAISDQAILKRRRWHYLVLDEAHNIKNHKSQRWQTLLSFRSAARLLLTGTPLQNNLAELWSLLFFLAPEQDEEGKTSFGDLSQFSKIFHRPVDQILENGRGALDQEAMEIVSKLHQVLRPHLLRRLKADVEKQMPKKYEHVTICRLSKRQRQLYDGYMSLAGTRDSFASGNYMSIINCLMQLRKVCNHPDLFETRQIVTSFAMPKSAIADYEIKELLIRRRLTSGDERRPLNLWTANTTSFAFDHGKKLNAEPVLSSIFTDASRTGLSQPGSSDTLVSALNQVSTSLQHESINYIEKLRVLATQRAQKRPLYSDGLLARLNLQDSPYISIHDLSTSKHKSKAFFETSSVLREVVQDVAKRSTNMKPFITRFCCTTPNVVAPGLSRLALTEHGVDLIEASEASIQRDPFHEARVRLSIAFPDKSLIQYDCGKLQQLDKLLRKLQSGGHRAVIFTQMTKVLDILEQFMNLHGHRYLRLDGATKIEQRQTVTERFNTDTRILAFISSSRSGGLGINLTGADTVIFYDLDWNPAMDKQCQDRCHRIGQTRDVHIYRFVSEGTIEANILRKSNQKRMLDDVVIQEGDFTTEYFNKLGADDDNKETDAAIDKVFGGSSTRMLQQAEDKEDQDAAKEAQKEELQADDADFGDKAADPVSHAETPTSATLADKQVLHLTVDDGEASKINERLKYAEPDTRDVDQTTGEQAFDRFASNPLPQDKPVFRDVDEDGLACPGGSDDYLIRLMAWELRDVAWLPPKTAKDKKKKKGSDFGIRR